MLLSYQTTDRGRVGQLAARFTHEGAQTQGEGRRHVRKCIIESKPLTASSEGGEFILS